MKINLNKYSKPKRYLRKQKECIIDIVNNCLRPATPEEDVRQRVLEFLHDVMEVPYNAMETEVNLSHYKKGLRGRIDIVIDVIYENSRSTLMIIECKAETVDLTDVVFQQADDYAEEIGVPIIMITNGIESDIYVWNNDKDCYDYLDYYPTYNEILNYDDLKTKEIEEYIFERPSYDEIHNPNYIKSQQESWDYINETTDIELAPHILNIAHALMDTTHTLKDLKINNYTFIEDRGIRYTTFENASGGSYPGNYRYLVIEDDKKNIQLISFSVFLSINNRSHLMVAVDDLNKHHNSIELSLNHYTKNLNGELLIYHNGRMTVGRNGQTKHQRVLDYTLNHTNLKKIDDKNIYLGKLDTTKLMYIDDDDFKELLGNLIDRVLDLGVVK